MGLLSRIEDWGGGLLGLGRGGYLPPPPGPVSVAQLPPALPYGSPQPQQPQPHPSGPSFLRILDDVLGGKTISESRDDWQTRQANAPILAAQRAAMLQAYQAAGQAHLTPEEQVALGLAPSKLGDAFASGSEAYTLSPGSTRNFRGQQVANNPVKGGLKGRWIKRLNPDQSTSMVWLPDPTDSSPASTPLSPVASPVASPMAPPNAADAVWAAMKQRESGGNGNAVSPAGAIGSTQMLPATAQSMAAKLGVPWRPELMKGNSPQALSYQNQLGRAYFDEGMQKYGGDPSKGAMYYHGGPNEAIWGPKTRAYAQAVTGGLSAAGGQPPPMLGGSAQDALTGPTIAWDAPKPKKAEDSTAVDQNIVKGLIEGRISPPTQKAAATPYWQAQLEAATQQDPTFDGVNFQARQKTRSDFTSGKSAQNITALNTVIGHLDHLDRTIENLPNVGGFIGAQWVNQAQHMYAQNTGEDQKYKDFETAKSAVANELTRVFRGSGGAEADIQDWQKKLDEASSPQALHEVVRSMAELINSRVEALGEQYSQGMGTTKDPLTLLTPDKQKAFQRLRGGASGAQSSGGQRRMSPQEAAQLKPGTVFVGLDGVERTRK